MKYDFEKPIERKSVSLILQEMYDKGYQQYMPTVIDTIRNGGDLSLLAKPGVKKGFSVALEDVEDFKVAIEIKLGKERHRRFPAINFRGEYVITGPQVTELYRQLNKYPTLEKYRMRAGRRGYLYGDFPLVRKIAAQILHEMGIFLREQNPMLEDKLSEVAPINHSLVTNQSNSEIYREEMLRGFRVHLPTPKQKEGATFSGNHDVNCLQPNPLTIPSDRHGLQQLLQDLRRTR